MKTFILALKINSPPMRKLDHVFQLWSLYSTKLLLKIPVPLTISHRALVRLSAGSPLPLSSHSPCREQREMPARLWQLRSSPSRCPSEVWVLGFTLWEQNLYNNTFTCLVSNPQWCLASLVTRATWLNFKIGLNFKAALAFRVELSHTPFAGP